MAFNPQGMQVEYDENGLPVYRRPMILPQIPPVSQVQVPQQTSQQVSQPDFSRIPINAAPPSPAEQGINQLQLPNREDPQYQNSRLRTVLNAIAGGLAGASGGARVGLEVGQGLRDQKYNRAMDTFKNKLGLLKEQQIGEKEQFQRGKEEQSLGTQRGVAQYNAYNKDRLATVAETNAVTKQGEASSKDKMRGFSQKYQQWKMDNPKLDDLQFIYNLPDEEQADALKMFKDMKQATVKTPEQIAQEAEARTTGSLKAQDTSLGQRVAATQAGTRAAASTVASANAPLGQMEQDSVTGALERVKQNPDTIHDIYEKLPTQREKTAFLGQYARSGGQWSRKLNTEEEKIRVTAGTAIGHADKILEMLKDPDIQRSIGPIQGRISQLAQTFGGSLGKSGQQTDVTARVNNLDLLKGLAPESKEAKLLDLLKYLVLFEASSTSGTRPSWQLIKELKETQGAKFNFNRMIGNLEAAKDSAGNRIAQLFKPTSQGLAIKDTSTTKSGFKEIK